VEILAEVKKAITVFNYAEKIKTNLIMASSLLEFLSGLKEDAEEAGAEKLLTAYFNALIVEVNIAASASQVEGFRDIASKLQKAVEQLKQHNHTVVQRLISEAISMATTHGSWAAQTLKEKNLI
jgi:flagellin-specific chaperone FliS